MLKILVKNAITGQKDQINIDQVRKSTNRYRKL